MAHYLFNLVTGESDERSLVAAATAWLRAGRWGVDEDDRHRHVLAVGDLALIYLGLPVRGFVGCAELASTAREATADVLLTRVEEWRPAVPMADVLARIDTSAGARGDFGTGVVRITETEFEVAVGLAHSG